MVGEGRGFHGMALPGYADDFEEENEHGGDVNDEGEHELTDDNGIGDMDGAFEQTGYR
jgi:hypothetical protein